MGWGSEHESVNVDRSARIGVVEIADADELKRVMVEACPGGRKKRNLEAKVRGASRVDLTFHAAKEYLAERDPTIDE